MSSDYARWQDANNRGYWKGWTAAISEVRKIVSPCTGPTADSCKAVILPLLDDLLDQDEYLPRPWYGAKP